MVCNVLNNGLLFFCLKIARNNGFFWSNISSIYQFKFLSASLLKSVNLMRAYLPKLSSKMKGARPTYKLADLFAQYDRNVPPSNDMVVWESMSLAEKRLSNPSQFHSPAHNKQFLIFAHSANTLLTYQSPVVSGREPGETHSPLCETGWPTSRSWLFNWFEWKVMCWVERLE